ncbi:hypothetical protein [Butyrivibrio sp. INlla16]|uniref:hypothetical protein n=1 Tax=Butyrivibrio sp. INlla16 TaxID=1520807 RepID=UPI00088C648D|nr:hypothetical protein [Butyrivibrio sp. INlla16]SDB68807.1 hypothetical protein SAMN02910263_04289 [Butyrivibrio sp. INlla16]
MNKIKRNLLYFTTAMPCLFSVIGLTKFTVIAAETSAAQTETPAALVAPTNLKWSDNHHAIFTVVDQEAYYFVYLEKDDKTIMT